MSLSSSSQPVQNVSEPGSIPGGTPRRAVNWPHVWAYIGLSFGLSLADRPGSLSEWRLEESWRFPDAPVPDAHASISPPSFWVFSSLKKAWSTERPTTTPRAGSFTIIS